MNHPTNKRVFWFGAGVSIASGMPDGASLTKKWLAHHLPEGEDQVLLDIFKRTSFATGKDLPRLEKVIEDSLWSMGADCLKNLAFFKDCSANWVHRVIAQDLLDHHGFAITTNFDEAVESAGDWLIPVMTPLSLDCPEWGLIKLHGSIGEEASSLGHCISNLEAGLAPKIRQKLLDLLDDPYCTFIFIGYSGSDYFDVTPLFAERLRLDQSFAARVALLYWTPDEATAKSINLDDIEVPIFFQAFAEERRTVYVGPTELTLPSILSCQPMHKKVQPIWHKGWSKRFEPTEEQRCLYAAKLYASLGLGEKSFYYANRIKPSTTTNLKRHRLLLNALRDRGLYETEYRMRKHSKLTDTDSLAQMMTDRQMAASLRLSGRWLRALFYYVWFLIHPNRKDKNLRREQLWCFAEAGIFAHGTCGFALSLPGGHYLGFPMLIPLRLMIALALWRLGVKAGKESAEVTDPHLREAIIRLSSFLCEPQGRIIDFVENIYFRNRPVLSFHDELGNGFRETDSLLGIVNQSRNLAVLYLHQLDWGFFKPLNNEHNKETIDALIEFQLRNSLCLAKDINDPMGMIKAATWLSRIDRWRGYSRMARGWHALANKIKGEMQKMDDSNSSDSNVLI